MTRLTASEARSIAASLWGKINHTYKTNIMGAYCFSCEGHGGFIVAKESSPESMLEFVGKYIGMETAIRYINDSMGQSALMYSGRHRGRKMNYNRTETVEYFVFEEDCAYTVAILAGINLKDKPIKESDAKQSFWAWYDEKNPAVQNRRIVEEKRRNGDPDLIVSAAGSWKTGIEGVCEVITADHRTHLVQGYDSCRDEYGEPYLSRCQTYSPA